MNTKIIKFLSFYLTFFTLTSYAQASSTQTWFDIKHPSAGALGDLDQDGSKEYYLWGKEDISDLKYNLYRFTMNGTEFEHSIVAGVESLDFPRSPRDTSARLIDIGDINLDGKPDLLTSSGLLLSSDSEKRNWTSLPINSEELSFSSPVIFVEDELLNKKNSLILLSDFFNLYQCYWQTSEMVCDEIYNGGLESSYGTYGELITGDFDGDGATDVIAGFFNPIKKTSLAFYAKNFSEPVEFNASAIDFNKGDLNGDGIDDLIAQVAEFITDFNSTSQIWFGSKDNGLYLFGDLGEMGNFDNHSDNSELVDFNQDGCLDYLQEGVDSDSAFGYKLSTKTPEGTCQIFSLDDTWNFYSYDPMEIKSRELRSGGMGVEVYDLNGDSKFEVFLRFGWGDKEGVAEHFSILQGVEL